MRMKDLNESILKSCSLDSRVCVAGACGYLAHVFYEDTAKSETWMLKSIPDMKFPLWTDKSYDKTALLVGYIGQMRTEQCSSNSLCCFALWLTAALLSPGRRLRPDVCPCVVSFIFSIHMIILMITFVPLQSPHAVYPAAPPFCSDQHPAAGAAPGHGHADHAALTPRHRHTETTAPHHGSGKLQASKNPLAASWDLFCL